MTTPQENFLTMAHTVNEVLKGERNHWTRIRRFARGAEELNDLIIIASETNAKADSKNTGTTKDKHSAGFEAIAVGVKIAKCASVYALDRKDMDLHDRLRFSRSSLLNRHDTEGYNKLKEVYELLNPIIAELEDYGVLPVDMQYYKNVLDAYNALLTKPREKVAERKTLNTTVLPEFINKMRAVLYTLDSMISLFEGTPLYSNYLNARKIVPLGSRSEKPDEQKENNGGETGKDA